MTVRQPRRWWIKRSDLGNVWVRLGSRLIRIRPLRVIRMSRSR